MTHAHAFIFDLDGTLVDSLQDITNTLNQALQTLARPPATPDQVRIWVGDGLATLCQRALPTGDATTLGKLVDLAKTAYQARCAEHTRIYPNILPMLNLLSARRSPRAILSNKPHDLTVELAKVLGLHDYFTEVRGCSREEDRKPAPRVALETARALGVEASGVFFVGDSATDIATARNAGMIAVSVTWGFRSRAELAAAAPDFLIDDPMDIVDLPERAFGAK